VRGQGAPVSSENEERVRLTRIIIALRDARVGRGQDALDTIARLGPTVGAPMVFLARDDALAAVGDASAQVSARTAWLASRNVNLRSIPLALAWNRAHMTPRRLRSASLSSRRDR
jgi:hypothetical protein